MSDCIPSSASKTDRKGYKYVYVGKKDGKSIYKSAHRDAWEKKHGPIPDGLQVRHKCDNPPCINDDHLELGTHQQNMQDKADRGRGRTNNRQGKANQNAKFTEDQVRYIRTSPETAAALARRYGTTRSAVSRIRTGKRWAHVA